MQMLALVGPLGWTLLSLLAAFLPFGIPPEEEEAVMSYVAPDDCVAYATWAAMATPNPASANQTEQLLAEPELKAFVAAIERNVLAAALAAAKKEGTPPEKADRIGNAVVLWIRSVLTRSGALYVSRLVPREQEIDLEGALLLSAGDTAAELERALLEILTEQEAPIEQTTIAGRKFHKLNLPGASPLAVVWGADAGYLKIGLGAGAIEAMNARIDARKEPAWLTQLKANLPQERRAAISYVNIKKLFDTFLPLAGPEAERIVNVWGLRQVTSFQAVSGLDQTGIVNRTLLTIDGQPRSILTLLDEKGITAADWKHIPPDALTAFGFVLDPKKAYDLVLQAVAETDAGAAGQAKAAIQQVQTQWGIEVPQALKALGNRWSLHVSPEGGWLGAAFTIEVREKARLQELEQRLLAKLQNRDGEIPGVGRIRGTEAAGQSIRTLSLQANLPLPVVPSWCLTDNRLVIGPNPQSVKAVISPQPADKSLADAPEIAAVLSGGNPPLALSYSDTAKTFANTYTSLQTMLPMLNAAAEQAGVPFNVDLALLPGQRTITRHLRPSVTVVRRTTKGLESETRQTLPMISVGPSTGVLVALLLPAVQAAREAARRQQGGNHIKQLLLSLHNYHDVHGALPPGYTVSKDGKPLLSWRVAILPFLEEQELYDQFHLDEPWDSEHNKKLVEKMPRVLRSPNSNAKPGMTNYLGVGGPKGVLGPPVDPATNSGISMAAVIDGTSNTIAVVEATDALAVEWTKPVDWVPDKKEPLKGLLGMRPNGFLAGFVDGHIQFIAKNIDPEMLLSLFSRDDGK